MWSGFRDLNPDPQAFPTQRCASGNLTRSDRTKVAVAVQWPRVNRVLSRIDFILVMLALLGIGLLIGIYWSAAW